MYKPHKEYKVVNIYLHDDLEERKEAFSKIMVGIALMLQDLRLRKEKCKQ